MMWAFLHPMFLWAAAAVVLPLVLHLLRRTRTTETPLSTIRFLLLAQKRSSSRMRLENLLLLLLRALLLIALALAFAMPVARIGGLGNLLGHTPRDVALVLDRSGSMHYNLGQITAWETARDAAVALVRGLQAGDRVSVVLAGENTEAVVPLPTNDRELVLRILNEPPLLTERSRMDSALRAAINTLRESSGREREIYIFTDGQALPWKPLQPDSTNSVWKASDADKDIAWFALLTGSDAPENTFVAKARIEAPVLFQEDAPSRIDAQVDLSAPPRPLTAALWVDGREIATRALENTRTGVGATLSFQLPMLDPGIHTARISIPADPLPVDDNWHFLLHVRQRRPTLVVGPAEDTFFLTTALNPTETQGSAIKHAPTSMLSGETLSGYEAIFLCNALPLSGQIILALENYVRDGGLLVLFPGPAAARAEDYGGWLCLPSIPQSIVTIAEPTPRPLRILTPSDPLFDGFTLPPGAAPNIGMTHYLRWSKLAPDATVLLSAGDDIPFLSARPFGQGRTLLFTTSAERRWSNLPLSPIFPALAHQIVESAALRKRPPADIAPARIVSLADLSTAVTATDIILAPDESPLTMRAVRRGLDVYYEAEPFMLPGIYTLLRGPERIPLTAVNAPREESDVAPLPDPTRTLPAWTGLTGLRVTRNRTDLETMAREHRRGRPMTGWFLGLALLLSVVELWLGNRMGLRAARPSPGWTISAAGKVTHKK